MNDSEEKRDFMPLFDFNLPQIMDEKERKLCLMETAKKYFEIKQKIIKENKKIS